MSLKWAKPLCVLFQNGVFSPDTLQDKLVVNTKALEDLPNIAQSLEIIRKKKEVGLFFLYQVFLQLFPVLSQIAIESFSL